jgi:hypothetical protein
VVQTAGKTGDEAGVVAALEVSGSEVVIVVAVAEHVVGGGEFGGRTATMAFIGPRRCLRRRNWARK